MSQAPTPQVLAILRMLIEERAGLRYAAEDEPLIVDKLTLRASEAGFESLLDYYYYLRYDAAAAAEFSALVDSLVVNETYFFREAEQLRAVLDEAIIPIVRAQGSARIWSAACSTGEEPLTIAMMLAERGILERVEVVATDISERALARARSGVFGARSFRSNSPPGGAERWLTLQDGRPVVDDAIRQRVRFSKLNLLDAAAIRELGVFDVIVCRNVLIYFSDETIRRLVGSFYEALRPGGALLVGTSESLLRLVTSLECEEKSGAFFYRRSR